MFPELVTFPSRAELNQDLSLPKFIPKLRGCIIIGLARSKKQTHSKEKILCADKLLYYTIALCEFETTYLSSN